MSARLPEWDAVLSPKSSWASLIVATEAEIDDFVRSGPADPPASIRIVRGRRCATKAALFNEWAAALQFPGYFGHNWDAFDECLADRSWLAGRVHVVVQTATDRVLSGHDEDRATFLGLLKSVAEAGEGPPLRVVFQCDAASERATRALLDGAGIST